MAWHNTSGWVVFMHSIFKCHTQEVFLASEGCEDRNKIKTVKWKFKFHHENLHESAINYSIQRKLLEWLCWGTTPSLSASTKRKERNTRIGKQLRTSNQTLRLVTMMKMIDFLHLVILFQFHSSVVQHNKKFFLFLWHVNFISYRHRF